MDRTIAVIRRQILNWCPPIIANCIRELKKSIGDSSVKERIVFAGDYASWEDASKASIGYDSDAIMSKVLESTLKVKNGQAAFERDSVTFDKMEYSWPLLANLLFAAAKNGGALDVVDFGGSLGSTYFQSRPFLDGLVNVRWSVIEQPHYVKIGRTKIADDRLQFFDTAGETLASSTPDVLLLSSVLQYIPNPYKTLPDLLSYSWKRVIVDRTPFILSRNTDRLTVQTVPSSIYAASYPSWFFAKEKFMQFFSKDFDLTSTWKCDECHSPRGETTSYEGFCFTRKGDTE